MRGQKSIEELIDLYPIRNQAVRRLLIDYFTRRRADTDYATLKNLVLHLAHHFWEKQRPPVDLGIPKPRRENL